MNAKQYYASSGTNQQKEWERTTSSGDQFYCLTVLGNKQILGAINTTAPVVFTCAYNDTQLVLWEVKVEKKVVDSWRSIFKKPCS